MSMNPGAKTRQLRCFERHPQLADRQPHSRLDGAWRDADGVGDLFIGHLAVLPQEEHFLFLRPQVEDGDPQMVQLFFSLDGRARGGAVACGQRIIAGQGLATATPGGGADVSSGIQGDFENPGLQVLDTRHRVAMPPTLDERFLQSIAGIFLVADQVLQRAEQLGLKAHKGRFQGLGNIRAGGCRGRASGRGDVHALTHLDGNGRHRVSAAQGKAGPNSENRGPSILNNVLHACGCRLIIAIRLPTVCGRLCRFLFACGLFLAR